MTSSVTPEKFFEAALVAIGPIPPHGASDYKVRAEDFIAFRHAVLGIGRMNLKNTPRGATAWRYSIGSYRLWWKSCHAKTEDDRLNVPEYTVAFDGVFGEEGSCVAGSGGCCLLGGLPVLRVHVVAGADSMTDLFETRFVDCFVVYGTTGEYSDRREWAIAVFLDEAHAINAVAKMDAYANELGLNLRNYDDTDESKIEAFQKRFGPHALESVDYTGVRFHYEKATFGG